MPLIRITDTRTGKIRDFTRGTPEQQYEEALRRASDFIGEQPYAVAWVTCQDEYLAMNGWDTSVVLPGDPPHFTIRWVDPGTGPRKN